MFYLRTKRANKLVGIALVASGAVCLTLSSWLKHILHISAGYMARSVDFVSGLVLGLGVGFVLAGFSSDLGESDFQD